MATKDEIQAAREWEQEFQRTNVIRGDMHKHLKTFNDALTEAVEALREMTTSYNVNCECGECKRKRSLAKAVLSKFPEVNDDGR